MKKALFLLSLCVLAVFAEDQEQDTITCPTISGLNFCSALNGQTVDLPFQLALTATDTGMNTAWNYVKSNLQGIASKYGFSLCQECLDAMKTTMCASIAPTCGFTTCLMSKLSELTQCLETCNNQYSCQATDYACLRQNMQCKSQCAINLVFAGCASHFMSRSMCESLINTCTCGQGSTAHCDLYSTSGRTLTMPSVSCSGSTGWCQSPTVRTLPAMDICPDCPANTDSNTGVPNTSAPVVCPNGHVCFATPTYSDPSAQATTPFFDPSDPGTAALLEPETLKWFFVGLMSQMLGFAL